VTDWSAYDPIADRYDAVWGPRFDAVAKLVWRSVARTPGAEVLDVGTGTGILPHALGEHAAHLASLTGSDRHGVRRSSRGGVRSRRALDGEVATPAKVERSLIQAGFVALSVETHAIESRLSPDQFIADRELTTGSRYARHVLGPQEWNRILQRARDELTGRFGDQLTFSRGALIGVGQNV
jgi:hypothetical protein